MFSVDVWDESVNVESLSRDTVGYQDRGSMIFGESFSVDVE